MNTDQNQVSPGVWGVQIQRGDPPAKRILWGLFLILVGGLFLAARLGHLELPSIWRLWPIVFFFIAAGHVFERRPGATVAMASMGAAFFAAEFHWLGLSYRTFWPLLVIALGAGLVIRALSGEDDRRGSRKEC